MLNLKKDVIRQLNTIYKLSFKLKYKEEIKERILFFVDKTYGSLTLLELKNIKQEINLIDNEIKELKIGFFNKYKKDLLNSFNPLWYLEKEKYIPVYSEKEYYKAVILKDSIEKVDKYIREKYRTNLIHLSKNRYGDSIRQLFKNLIERRLEKDFVFKERELELKQLKKEIEENLNLYKSNAKADKKRELNQKREQNETLCKIQNIADSLEIGIQLKEIENQEENYFISFHYSTMDINNKMEKHTNSSFDYLYCVLLLKEINEKLGKF